MHDCASFACYTDFDNRPLQNLSSPVSSSHFESVLELEITASFDSWSSSTSSKLADTSDFAERRGRDSRLAFDLTSSVHHVHRVKFTELSRKKILLLLFLSVHHHVWLTESIRNDVKPLIITAIHINLCGKFTVIPFSFLEEALGSEVLLLFSGFSSRSSAERFLSASAMSSYFWPKNQKASQKLALSWFTSNTCPIVCSLFCLLWIVHSTPPQVSAWQRYRRRSNVWWSKATCVGKKQQKKIKNLKNNDF